MEFTFLLSIPVVIGVALLEMHHMPLFEGDESTVFAAGTFSAFIAGLASLTFLIHYLKKHTLDVFAYYRVGLAVLIMAFIVIS